MNNSLLLLLLIPLLISLLACGDESSGDKIDFNVQVTNPAPDPIVSPTPEEEEVLE